MTLKNVLKWEEAKLGEFGDSLEDTQAEFQSIGLVSKGSSQIKTEKVKKKYSNPSRGVKY